LLKALALERRRHFRKGEGGWQILNLSLLDELVKNLLVVVQKTKGVFPEEVGLTAEHISFGIVPRH
jgi:allantoicase